MEQKITDGVYYEDGVPKHRGIVEIDNEIYYAGHNGKLAVGHKVVHRSMANGLVEHGTYEFDESGKIIRDSFVAPTNNKKDPKKILKKIKPIHAVIALLVAALIIATVIESIQLGGKHLSGDDSQTGQSGSDVIDLPSFDSEVYLCGKALEQYYKGEVTFDAALSSGNKPYSPFTFEYKLQTGTSAVLELDGKTYALDPDSSTLAVDNLMTGKTYRYTVTVTGDSGSTVREGSFTTAETSRFITLPGVINTRDIGGYMTDSGKKIKQGLLIRGSEIDGLVASEYFLTDTSAAEPFGFKFDFDLRAPSLFEGNYRSRLGEGVKHKFYNGPQYGEIFSTGAKDRLRSIFKDLSDPDNYPMYMHCTFGTDRTGTVIFFLQGILGVSEEDMKHEYQLSGFEIPSSSSVSRLNGIYGGLEGYKGSTINEKIKNYLTDTVGMTSSQIESIRKIFLGD